MASKPLRIAGFGDAVVTAWEIKDRFGRAHAAAVLDCRGKVLDLIAFTSPQHTIQTPLDWATCRVLLDQQAASIVLFSAVEGDVREVREDDVHLYQRIVGVFAEMGVAVLDWIQADPERFRSFAFTSGADRAWKRGGRKERAGRK